MNRHFGGPPNFLLSLLFGKTYLLRTNKKKKKNYIKTVAQIVWFVDFNLFNYEMIFTIYDQYNSYVFF